MQDFAQILNSINSKLSFLIGENKKVKWVKVGAVKKLTGWNKEELRSARVNGYVKTKKENGLWYDLSSIDSRFIINIQKEKAPL